MNKKNMVLSIIALATLLVLVVGATFAYFTSQTGTGAGTDVNVITSTTDNLTFNTEGEIAITATQQTFGKDAGNMSDSAKARAILIANNATNSATQNYYVYLNVIGNNFEYTTDNETAELILTITDPNGNELTTLDGYNYVTVGDVRGFDVTEAKGLIKIGNLYEITTTGTTIHEWNVELTLINLDSDQNANTGKTFRGELLIQKEEKIILLADFIKSGYGIEEGLYYHDENLENGAGDNSYRYAGETPNNYVCFGSDAETCPGWNLYRIIGVFDNQVKLISNAEMNNTWLGTDGNYITSNIAYYWNKSGVNNWSSSLLNTVNLNTNYITNIGSDWSSKIAETTWHVGGGTYANLVNANAQAAYSYEIGENRIKVGDSGCYDSTGTAKTCEESDLIYKAKIGLIYISDFYYAASPGYWTTAGGNIDEIRDYKYSNWLANNFGNKYWTITRISNGSTAAILIGSAGSSYNPTVSISSTSVSQYQDNRVKLAFSLLSTVTYQSGTGTQDNPIRIS